MEQQVPDFYAENVQVGMSPFGVILSFGTQPPGQTGSLPPNRVCVMRMSLEHAKVMAMILKKQLKVFEENLGSEIPLHPQLWQQMGLSRQEDW